MKNRNKNILMLLMLMITFTIIGLSGCANKDKDEAIKIWNKTGYEISVNDNKIKKDEALELKKQDIKSDDYDISVSYDDGIKHTLGSIKISEIKNKIEIRYEDEVTYLLYETKDGNTVNTKQEELDKLNKKKEKEKENSTENNSTNQEEPVESNKNQNSGAVQKEAPSSNDTGTHESSNNDNCVDVDDPNNYY